MPPPPIALQLYSLRTELARDFDRVVEQVADLGYAGVETAGFEGTTPDAAGRLFKRLGLQVVGAHAPLPLGAQKNKVLDSMAAIGATRLICASQPAESFSSLDGIQRVCDTLNAAAEVARATGLSFGYHNHWFEFQPVDGRVAYARLLECLDQDIFMELDTYWVKTAGADPAEWVRRLGSRAPLLHIKDGPCVKGEPMMAVGQGQMDFRSIADASAGIAEWMVVELDTCATDPLIAVAESYTYLTKEGLAYGKNG